MPGYQDKLASCWFDLASAYGRRKDPDASIQAYQRAADIRTRLCAAAPGRPAQQWKLGLTLSNLAVLHARRQRRDEAVEVFGRAAAAYEAGLRTALGFGLLASGLAGCCAAWAAVERQRGRFAAAAAVVQRRCDAFPADAAELTAAAREFARIADRDATNLNAGRSSRLSPGRRRRREKPAGGGLLRRDRLRPRSPGAGLCPPPGPVARFSRRAEPRTQRSGVSKRRSGRGPDRLLRCAACAARIFLSPLVQGEPFGVYSKGTRNPGEEGPRR